MREFTQTILCPLSAKSCEAGRELARRAKPRRSLIGDCKELARSDRNRPDPIRLVPCPPSPPLRGRGGPPPPLLNLSTKRTGEGETCAHSLFLSRGGKRESAEAPPPSSPLNGGGNTSGLLPPQNWREAGRAPPSSFDTTVGNNTTATTIATHHTLHAQGA